MAPSCDVVNAEVCSCVHFAQSKLRSVCVGVVVGGGELPVTSRVV